MKIGIGYDVHRLVENREFILGGVRIEHSKGILGHSDGDVLTHALINAILGAMGLGDIGQYFPSHDEKYKNIDSTKLLIQIKDLMSDNKYSIINIDTMIIAQEPKLSIYYKSIKHNLAQILDISHELISIKSTTTDNIGAIGAGQAIACQCVILLDNKNYG